MTKPRKKRIRIPTPDDLAEVAVYYLSRFAASEASLRQVLENRLRRARLAHEGFAQDKAAQENLRKAIDAIVARHKKTGALNDEAFAAMKVGSLRRAGRSAQRIKEKLRQKGVAADIIRNALTSEDDASPDDAELKAARAFAKRKGLGPYRRPSAGLQRLSLQEMRKKDFAAMARAGFGYDTVRDVLGEEVEGENGD